MKQRINRKGLWMRLAVLGFLILLPSSALASILSVYFGDMLEKSELIFEGNVVSVNQNAFPAAKLPHTCITFEVVEILKGSRSGEAIDLCFLGGTRGKFIMKVPEIKYPEMAEKGIRRRAFSVPGTNYSPVFVASSSSAAPTITGGCRSFRSDR